MKGNLLKFIMKLYMYGRFEVEGCNRPTKLINKLDILINDVGDLFLNESHGSLILLDEYNGEYHVSNKLISGYRFICYVSEYKERLNKIKDNI